MSNDRDELAALTGALRATLARHARAGAWAVSGAKTWRPDTGTGAGTGTGTGAGAGTGTGRLSVLDVRTQLGECTRCKLSETRTRIVFGAGPATTDLMFIGEAPGADEDRTGVPFVGRAGELLDKMIVAMGWRRDDVYIANVLKCRPPGNRAPGADEVASCQPFLNAQIEAIAPRIIVALGRPAANAVLGIDAPIGTLRGRFHDARGWRVMPTFHPAYLLREPDRKRDAWADLKLVMAELDRLGIRAPRPAG